MLLQALIVAALLSSPSALTIQRTVQLPPRDAAPPPATSREAELKTKIAASAAEPEVYFEVAKLQEERRAVGEAEETLLAGRRAFPSNQDLLLALASFYNRRGMFEATIEVLEQAAASEPSNPGGYQMVATFYQEKASKDASLSSDDRWKYISKGVEATDRALALKPDYVEALIYKNIFLRMQANLESDRGQQQALIAEADTLRNRATELQKQQRAERGLPPLPTNAMAAAGMPVAAEPRGLIDGVMPLRVGGNVKPPRKIRDVRPVYPSTASEAQIQGVVILEVAVTPDGRVVDPRILRSIPLLDEAALDAVSQWVFEPTLLNGVAVPVVMTVTVNFTLQ